MKKISRIAVKIVDIIGGLFLILTGLFLLYIYVCLYSKVDNLFISFTLILFLLGLGIVAIVLGFRRFFITINRGH